MKREENLLLARKIYNSVRRNFVLVISSDFTHAGNNYGFPISYERAEQTDKQAIKKIEQLNSEEFFDLARKTTICGRNAVVTGIELARYLRLKPRLIDFSSSTKLSGKENFVNYAGIVFE
jgi:AmmeMemoRadiSam system protein B